MRRRIIVFTGWVLGSCAQPHVYSADEIASILLRERTYCEGTVGTGAPQTDISNCALDRAQKVLDAMQSAQSGCLRDISVALDQLSSAVSQGKMSTRAAEHLFRTKIRALEDKCSNTSE